MIKVGVCGPKSLDKYKYKTAWLGLNRFAVFGRGYYMEFSRDELSSPNPNYCNLRAEFFAMSDKIYQKFKGRIDALSNPEKYVWVCQASFEDKAGELFEILTNCNKEVLYS